MTKYTISFFIFAYLFSSLVSAQNSQACFKVAIANSPPWSQYDDENERYPSGFNIDLWQQIEKDLRLCSEWHYADDMKDIIIAAATNKVDVGLVNFPASDALQLGLQTATVKEYTTTHIIKKVMSDLTSHLTWKMLWIALLVIIIATIIRWIVDRFQPQEYRRFKRGLLKEFLEISWWNINLIIGWEGFDASRGLALFFDFAWHILGMVLFGALLSILTVSFSLAASGNQIQKQPDVDGKVVAVLKETNYVKHYLRQRDSTTQFIEVDDLSQAFELLTTFKVDAVVHNSVELAGFFKQNYDNTDANIRLLPKVVNYQQYGIIINPQNAYKEAIEERLAKYKQIRGLEASIIESLSNKWGITLQ